MDARAPGTLWRQAMKVAYLASPVTLPGSPQRRIDAFEHDRMMDALRPAFAARGMALHDISWDDETVDWADFAAVIIGTCWDYWDREAEFLAALARIEAATRLFNPLSLVRWNRHKRYLRDLEARGARLIPTLWLDAVDEAAAETAFGALDTDRLVFKRQVGAGAAGQHLVRRGERLPHLPLPMMVQPYLDAIAQEGELSFVFIDGALSHALVKRPAAGDYRIQSSYGGSETAITPHASDVAAAQAILETLDETPLYARIDMLRGDDGTLYLMELELIEPYLYPLEGPELGERLAEALVRRL